MNMQNRTTQMYNIFERQQLEQKIPSLALVIAATSMINTSFQNVTRKPFASIVPGWKQ